MSVKIERERQIFRNDERERLALVNPAGNTTINYLRLSVGFNH